MATRAEKIVEQLAIWGVGNRCQDKIDCLVSEAVKWVNNKVGEYASDKCEWCGKDGGELRRLHSECYEAIMDGEGVV